MRLKEKKHIADKVGVVYNGDNRDLYWVSRPAIVLAIDNERKAVKLEITLLPFYLYD